MPKFLLDANLSPKTARFLTATFGFDMVALQASRLGELPDHAGTIYLDLPSTHRFVPRPDYAPARSRASLLVSSRAVPVPVIPGGRRGHP